MQISTIMKLHKKYWNLWLLSFCVVTILTSCEDEEFCRNGKGPIEVEDFNLETFNGVHLKTDARVYISQGDVQQVSVEAERTVFEELDLDVRNGILLIDLDRCFFDYDMEVFLTLTEPITELIISGSGDIMGEGELFAAEQLNLEISGSGEIRANLDAVNIDSRISGSGDMKLSGSAARHEVSITGSGDLRAYDLLARDYDIRISGSGRAEIFIEGGTLDATITGSGDIRYRGTPETVSTQVTGSGNIINVN